MSKLQLFWLISLHHILHNKLRMLFVLIIIAIASTSMFVAIDSIFKRNDSRLYATNLLHGRSSIIIESETAKTLDDGMLEQIRNSAAVDIATPLVLDRAFLIDHSLLIPLTGIDPETERQIRPYQLIEGEFIRGSGQIMITDVLADTISVGENVRIAGQNGITSYLVTGILAQEGIAALNGGDMFFLHYEDVQAIRHNDSIDLVNLIHSGTIESSLSELDTLLVDEITVDRVAEIGEKSLTDYVIDVLGIISNGLPALLGTLMITSTIAAGIAQRRKELAILRALGTTSGGLLQILIIEAIILGLIGSIPGIGLALLLNQGLLTASATIDGFSATSTTTTVPLWIYIFVILTALSMSVVAMWLPAKKIISIDPTEAMQPPRIQNEELTINPLRLIIGIVLILLAIVSRFMLDNSTLIPLVVLSGIVFVLAGTYAIFPPLLTISTRKIPALMRRLFGFDGLLAAENLNIRHQRAMASGLTSMIIIWFYILVNGAGAGQGNSVNYFLNNEFDRDIILSGAGEDARSTETVIPSEIVEAISNHDEIQYLVKERLAPYSLDDIEYTIRALDLEAFRATGSEFAWENGNPDTAYQQLQSHDRPTILIGGFDALVSGLRKVGTRVSLTTASGDIDFEVAGTIYNSSGGNVILMDYDLYATLWNDTQVDRMSIIFNPDTDVEVVRRNLSLQYATSGLVITDRDEIKALFTQSSPGLIIGLILFPFMMIGIANMLFISVLDRRREFGMLRAIGALRGQIVRSVIIEAVILVIFACTIAIPAAYLAIELMLFERIVGASIQPDGLDLLIMVLVLILVAVISSYLPARRAGRLDILDALHYE